MKASEINPWVTPRRLSSMGINQIKWPNDPNGMRKAMKIALGLVYSKQDKLSASKLSCDEEQMLRARMINRDCGGKAKLGGVLSAFL